MRMKGGNLTPEPSSSSSQWSLSWDEENLPKVREPQKQQQQIVYATTTTINTPPQELVYSFLCELFQKLNNKDKQYDCQKNTHFTTQDDFMDISAFDKLIHLVPELVKQKYHNMRIPFGWFLDPYTIRASWSLLFAGRLKSLDTSKPCKSTSVNCRYSFAPTEIYDVNTNKYRESSLFVKVVSYPLPPKTDHILVDIINSALLKAFHATRPHITFYIESFLSFNKITKGDFVANTYVPKESIWEFNKYCNLSSQYSPFYIPTSNLPHKSCENKCYVYLADAIHGKTLMDLMKTSLEYNLAAKARANAIVIDKKTKIDALCQMAMTSFVKFFDAITHLGYKFGMLHNDFHLGNLMFDEINNKLVCIDYGRMHFQDATLTSHPVLTHFITREVKKLGVDSLSNSRTEVTYDNVMSAFHKQLKSTKVLKDKDNIPVYPMVIADIMALCGNMYVFYLITQSDDKVNKVKTIVDKIINFDYGNDKVNLYTRDITLKVTSDFALILNEYQEVLTHDWNQIDKTNANLLSIIVEGLLFIALLINYSNGQITTGMISVQLNDKKSLFHSHFQYIYSAQHLSYFIDIIMKLPTNPNNILNKTVYLQKLRNYGIKLGGRSSKKLGQNAGEMDFNFQLEPSQPTFYNALEVKDVFGSPVNVNRIGESMVESLTLDYGALKPDAPQDLIPEASSYTTSCMIPQKIQSSLSAPVAVVGGKHKKKNVKKTKSKK